MLVLDESGFKAKFAGSPVRRAGYVNFMRNVLIAAGNSDQLSHLPAIKTYLSSPYDVIKATAIWALKQLLGEGDFMALKTKESQPTDPDIIAAEW